MSCEIKAPSTSHARTATVTAFLIILPLLLGLASPAAGQPQILEVINSASYLSGPVSPGQIVTIFGENLGPEEGAGPEVDEEGRLATRVAGVQVLFGAEEAPLYFVGKNQINCQVPYSLDSLESVEIRVVADEVESAPRELEVAPTSVGVFCGGDSVVVAITTDGKVVNAQHPLRPGEIATLYATGEGKTEPACETGKLAMEAPYPSPMEPVRLWIHGREAEVLWAGRMPQTAGVMQVNFRVPSQVTAPRETRSVELAVESNGATLVPVKITVGDDAGRQEAAITVVPNEPPPSSAPEPRGDKATTPEDTDTTVNVLANDEDPDGDPLHIVSVSQPARATVSHDGQRVKVEPQADFFGDLRFDYTVSDGTFWATADVGVTVEPVNDPPQARDDIATVLEGGGPKTIDVLANDTDPDGDPVSLSIAEAPVHGGASVSGQAVVYTPDAGYHGPDTFRYRIEDPSGAADEAGVQVSVPNVNDPPVATPGETSVPEGREATISLTGQDPDDDPLVFSIERGPQHGRLSRLSNRDRNSATVRYIHDGSETASDSFTFTVSDGLEESAPATVTIRIEESNDKPEAIPTGASVDEGADVTITLRGRDAENGKLGFSITAMPEHGTLGEITKTGDRTAQVTYTHDGSESTTDSFAFEVDDGGRSSAPATVEITVQSVNDSATAEPVSAAADEGGSVTIELSGTDAEGGSLDFAITGPPSNGNLGSITKTGDATAKVTYTHDGGETDSDSFQYTVDDGHGASAPATVSIAVIAVNDPPAAQASSTTVDEGAGVAISLSGTDADGDELTFAVAGGPANGSLGSITKTGDATATVTYTHDGGETSSDSFTFTVDDGSGPSSPATVSITVSPVNDPPAAQPTTRTLDEGQAVAVALSGTDAEGDILTFAIASGPTNGSLGSITKTGDATATVTYTHDGGSSTSDSFTFTADDGSGPSAPATVTITVNQLNEPPVAQATSSSVDEGQAVAISLSGTDADGDVLNFAVAGSPSNGSLGSITKTGDATATITYTHNGGETTSDSFTFTVNDGSGPSAPATVSITVNPVNDPPSAQATSSSVDEGQAVAISLSATDADGDVLSFAVASGPSNGSLGAISKTGDATATVTYTHNGSSTTSDSFTFTVNDGSGPSSPATVSITINPVNDPPSAQATSTSVDEGQAVSISLSGTDADGDVLSFAVAGSPSNGSLGAISKTGDATATVTYTHDGSETTSDSFTFTVNDGSGPSAPAAVSITVNPTNDPPSAQATSTSVDEGQAVAISLSGTDADGDVLSFSVASGPSNGSLGAITKTGDAAATVTYTHDGSETMSDSFTFTVNDGSGPSAPATVSITVNPVNDPPSAQATSTSVDEGQAVAINLSGADADGDVLSFSVASGPSNGSLGAISKTGDATASVTYTHDGSQTTSDSFTFTVNDGSGPSSPATVSITINPTNDPPSAQATSDSVDEGQAVAISLSGADPDGDVLSFAVASGPSNGSLGAISKTGDATATVTYTHNGSETTSDSFTFTVNDGSGPSSPATVSITINPTNDPPSAQTTADTVDEGQAVAISLSGSDPDGDVLSFAVASGPSNGSLGSISKTGDATATVTYTHDGSETTSDSFTFTVNDGSGPSSPATVSITVNPVSDPPSANAGADTVTQGTLKTISLSGTDVEGDDLTFAIGTGPSHGSLGSISKTGANTATVDYTHDGGASVSDSFTFTVNDGTTTSSPATISLTISASNQSPSADNKSETCPVGDSITVTLTGSDPDGDPLTFFIVSTPGDGVLGSVVSTGPTSATVQYTHTGIWSGSDSFTYRAYDGAEYSSPATVSITLE